MKIEANNEKYLYHILCVLAVGVALLPVACSYIMSGGIVYEWIARMDEIVMGLYGGRFYLFPSAETVVGSGVWENGMNSNLWFLIPGLLYRLSGDIVLVYRLSMLVIQIGTLLTAKWLFQRIFAEEETGFSAYFGILLYMTCPYRIYVCYDQANMSRAVAWMLLPLYAGAVTGILREKKNIRDIAIAAIALAGIGYADVIVFMILVGGTVLTGIVLRKPRALIPVAVGMAMYVPGLYRVMQYLFLNAFQEFQMPLQSIMKSGYRFGEFFSLYVYKGGRPGFGMGMMLCLLSGLWMNFVHGKKEDHRSCQFFVVVSVILLALSFYYFPWDILQRLGGWSLKLISLIGTPSVFAGLAYGCLCVPAACGVRRISRHENKVIAFAIPVLILIACVGLCIYQCNTLTYSRIPLTTP